MLKLRVLGYKDFHLNTFGSRAAKTETYRIVELGLLSKYCDSETTIEARKDPFINKDVLFVPVDLDFVQKI